MSDTERPDVLLLMTDQWNPTCVGYTGADPALRTPNIDALARDGVVFDAAYTQSPVCMPARCSFLSGLYPHNHGFFMNFLDQRLPVELGTMFQDIRAAGYRTGHVGKSHVFEPPVGGDYRDHADYFDALGFDSAVNVPGPYMVPFFGSYYSDYLRERGLLERYLRDIAQRFYEGQYFVRPNDLDPEHHNDSVVGKAAIEFIEQTPVDQPYCLRVSFPGPHTPLDAPGAYGTMYDPADVADPPNLKLPVKQGGETFGHDEIRRMRANYYGKIALIDEWCGRIVGALKQRGTWERTFVVFFSDHGENMGSQGRLSKGSYYEESVRVPMVMRWPGRLRPGVRTDALAQVIDIYPTVVDAVGGEMSGGRFGRSLLPLAAGETESVHDAVFSEIASQKNPPRFMVRTPRHKWWIDGESESLFDLQQDPHELNDLAKLASTRSLRSEMRERLSEFLRATQYNRSRDYRGRFDRTVKVDASDPVSSLYRDFRKFSKGVLLPCRPN